MGVLYFHVFLHVFLCFLVDEYYFLQSRRARAGPLLFQGRKTHFLSSIATKIQSLPMRCTSFAFMIFCIFLGTVRHRGAQAPPQAPREKSARGQKIRTVKKNVNLLRQKGKPQNGKSRKITKIFSFQFLVFVNGGVSYNGLEPESKSRPSTFPGPKNSLFELKSD